jgi:cytochrome oxidase Cu insertion factor (SCO1/SenC/PrrC family)
MDTPLPEKKPLNPWTVWIPIIVMALGVVVFYNYLISQSLRKDRERPAYMGKLETDLTLTERTGKTVRLSELKGKVLLISYVFTRCPRSCPGVISKVREIHNEFGGDPGLHLLSFSVDPGDTAAMMDEFAKKFQVTAPNWWFVNGTEKEVRNFMTFKVKFRAVQDIPEADRLTPDDKYMHDARVALVDHFGNVRQIYDIANIDPEQAAFWNEKIRADLKYLLEERKRDPYKP